MSSARTPEFLQLFRGDAAAIREEIAQGLRAGPAAISPKYLYDALGARLFEAITELQQYYPTRTEAAIFEQHRPAIAAAIGQGLVLVDLGAGNCQKAAALFGALQPSRYVAVDISVEFMRTAMLGLQRQYPALPMLGVGMDFSGGLELPPQVGPGRRLWFYPGSSIGNFSPGASLELLRQVRAGAQGGGLLIGVDLVKPLAVLEAAYDDDLGVTAAFNRNLLLHVNRLLGTDFDIRQWCHRAFFNVTQSRIEMHLQATQDLVVHWPGASRAFAQGEGIHTENSYKYTSDGFEALLRQAGFGTVQRWSDSGEWFALFWAAN